MPGWRPLGADAAIETTLLRATARLCGLGTLAIERKPRQMGRHKDARCPRDTVLGR